jgi:hypothetical protein
MVLIHLVIVLFEERMSWVFCLVRENAGRISADSFLVVSSLDRLFLNKSNFQDAKS